MSPDLNFTGGTSMTVLALLRPAEKNLNIPEIYLGNLRNFNHFSWHQSINQWQRPINQSALQTYRFPVICGIHPLILPMSKTPSRCLNFLDFGVYVVMTPIFPTNQRKCVISSRIVVILILLSTQLNTGLNRLINSQHCKRHRRKRMREFKEEL